MNPNDQLSRLESAFGVLRCPECAGDDADAEPTLWRLPLGDKPRP